MKREKKKKKDPGGEGETSRRKVRAVLSFDGVTRTGGAVGWLQHEDDGVSIAYQSKSTGASKRCKKFTSVSTEGGLAI